MADFLSRIDLEDLPEDQYEIAEIIGIENYRELVRIFGGTSIRIWKADSLTKEIRNTAICTDYAKGHSIKYLCRKYGLSDRGIRNIIQQDGQGSGS